LKIIETNYVKIISYRIKSVSEWLYIQRRNNEAHFFFNVM